MYLRFSVGIRREIYFVDCKTHLQSITINYKALERWEMQSSEHDTHLSDVCFYIWE